jgi:hypothetical protein
MYIFYLLMVLIHLYYYFYYYFRFIKILLFSYHFYYGFIIISLYYFHDFYYLYSKNIMNSLKLYIQVKLDLICNFLNIMNYFQHQFINLINRMYLEFPILFSLNLKFF